MPRTDVQLLVATQRGSESAARELWARQSGAMLAHARSILRDSTRAEDAVQQVFCKLLTLDRRTLVQVRDVRAWLAQLVRREALNQLRSTQRETCRANREQQRAFHKQTNEFEPSADDDAVQAALGRLARRLREVVVLRHVAGLTFDQIAMALNVNRNTAAGRYRQAMDRLRAELLTDTSHSHSQAAPPTEVNHARVRG